MGAGSRKVAGARRIFMNEGQRFSLLYLDRSKIFKDSQRFRNRLAAFYWKSLFKNNDKIVTAIQSEIGAEVPSALYGYSITDFIKETELRDLLDSITVIYKVMISNYES